MKNSEKPKESAGIERGRRAESLLAEIFEQAGWRVEREPRRQKSQLDMIVRRPGVVYGVEVKAAVEGRGDRLVPLFAQAVLQSLRGARQNAAPLAVVAAPKISQRAADQVLKFAEHYAPTRPPASSISRDSACLGAHTSRASTRKLRVCHHWRRSRREFPDTYSPI